MRRSVALDLLLLTALCAVVYGFGLTAHGLTNWHEAQRALVARDMQARGDWVVPTLYGKPYLSKPPMIYWCELAIASLRRARADEFDLRLTVALGGWAGVAGTYVIARRMFSREVALWSSLFLATGFLYVHSARIGEVDILLVPFTVVAVGALYVALQTYLETQRTNLPALILATIATSGVMLTKGPPGLLIVACASYGAVLLRAAWMKPPDRWMWTAGIFAGLAVALLGVWVNRKATWDLDGVAGVGVLVLMMPLPVITLLQVVKLRGAGVLRTFGAMQPLLVIGVPIIVFWGWGKMVEARVGKTAVQHAAQTEAAENLRPLVPQAPFDTLEAAAYGAGLGSLSAICAALALVRSRRMTLALWVLVGWTTGAILSFSTLGKAVPRYLTPMWPALSLLGGWWFASVVTRDPGAVVSSQQDEAIETQPETSSSTLSSLPVGPGSGAALKVGAATAVLLLAAGQAWWYGYAWERQPRNPSPRAFVAELLAVPGADPAGIATYEFTTPMLDYYVGRRLDYYSDTGARKLRDLRKHLAATRRPLILLILERSTRGNNSQPAIERLRAAGFVVEPIPVGSHFTVDKQRIRVLATWVRIGSAGHPHSPPG